MRSGDFTVSLATEFAVAEVVGEQHDDIGRRESGVRLGGSDGGGAMPGIEGARRTSRSPHRGRHSKQDCETQEELRGPG
jgi:hypothetical protein